MATKSQVNPTICYLCDKKTTSILCKTCASNPFLVEDARKKAAASSDTQIFKELYAPSYASIPNKNTGSFWNSHFEEELNLSQQDQMTRHKIKKIVSLFPNKKLDVLDVGFGQGYFEEQVADENRKVNITGIDISSEVVKRAQEKFKGKFIQGDLHTIKTKFKKNSFDAVVAIEVIEHISPDKIFKFFEDIHYLLKPQGILVVSTPLNEHLKTLGKNPSGHVREYSVPVLKKELELSGFKATDVFTFTAFGNFYTLKTFLAKIFKNHWEENNVVVRARRV